MRKSGDGRGHTGGDDDALGLEPLDVLGLLQVRVDLRHTQWKDQLRVWASDEESGEKKLASGTDLELNGIRDVLGRLEDLLDLALDHVGDSNVADLAGSCGTCTSTRRSARCKEAIV